jgi:hypothetical protein
MTQTVVDETKKVAKAMRAATITSLSRAAAYIRGIAQRSISKKKGPPGPPGKPPRSPTGALRAAIAFNVDREAGVAVVGPTNSGIGLIGQTHEFGGIESAVPSRKRVPRVLLGPGGYGPIRELMRGVAASAIKIGKNTYIVGPLRTAAQVERARRILEKHGSPPELTSTLLKPRRRYPSRPFMGPALQRSRERLPEFWKNVLKRS